MASNVVLKTDSKRGFFEKLDADLNNNL